VNTDSRANKRTTRQRRRKPPLSLTLLRLAFSKLGPLFPSLFGAWAYRLWFSTRRLKAPRREQPWTENAGSEIIELAGIPIMTWQWGKPQQPLVVLMHGWNGRGSQLAAFAGPLVKAGFRVLAYDAPGHGHSPGNSTNIFTMSNVLTAIADKVSPIYAIVGHSFGGMTASLAISKGLHTSRVVFISTPATFDYLVELFVTGLRIPPVVKHKLVARLQARFGDRLFDEIATVTTCQALAGIPALVIHDEKDLDVPVTHARQIHQACPGSELMITSGLGHKRILYNKKVIEAVGSFLAKK
jgi:pimeloyl-ACP methyl ester carboxylesterase